MKVTTFAELIDFSWYHINLTDDYYELILKSNIGYIEKSEKLAKQVFALTTNSENWKSLIMGIVACHVQNPNWDYCQIGIFDANLGKKLLDMLSLS